MRYINKPDHQYKTYDEVVDLAIELGIDRKRVYLCLMAFGITGDRARVLSAEGGDYLPPVKMAVKNGAFITSVSICKECGNLKAA